jgi:23S rRNA (adenine2503-C2)-methyltransferase
MKMQRFDSSEGNVWKYVFDFGDGAITEAVLYRYGSFRERTVVCCSVQSGCPVGCVFCGTGNKFVRNLSGNEISAQVAQVLNDQVSKEDKFNCKKLQIMFMSMGEPFLNYDAVEGAIRTMNTWWPHAELLVSTVAPSATSNMARFMSLSQEIDKIGLQFSIHASLDSERDRIIPFRHKMELAEIRDYGVEWWHRVGRKPYLNYCITPSFGEEDIWNLRAMFPPNVFCFTFSVLCSPNETMKEAGYRDLEYIRFIEREFADMGYDTRVFDPAGQDDIGGGCGQLWYVQRKLRRAE